ncbi:MAG TPA: hypothetical protein VED01_28065 [Burkholderiales bacterium]|nr:hypothetical protein [Burkholderiales bacterium]
MLADPRRYGAGDAGHPLLALAARDDSRDALVAALRELAQAQRDTDIGAALAAAPSAQTYSRLWHALCAAVERPAGETAVMTRVFAMPWVIVCGASAAASLSCVLPDVGMLSRALEENGAFGGSRNVGFGNALVSIEQIERLAPSEVLQASESTGLRALEPAPIALSRGAEEVHVRLLVGASVEPSNAPGVIVAGSNIGAWGTPALRAMAAQLATPAAQVLPMPRPPAGLYSAAWLGRRAGIETAFNLFISNCVRRFRAAVGDPQVTVSMHASGELRVTLTTPFDDTMVEGFRWPLHPADDLADVERSIAALVGECRLGEPLHAPGVLPDYSASGALLFPRA